VAAAAKSKNGSANTARSADPPNLKGDTRYMSITLSHSCVRDVTLAAGRTLACSTEEIFARMRLSV